MGKGVSTQRGTRSARDLDLNPYDQNQELQVATVRETGSGSGQFLTATAIEGESGSGQTATATIVPPRTTATTPNTVWAERIETGNSSRFFSAVWTNNGGRWSGNCNREWANNLTVWKVISKGFQLILALSLLGVCVGIPIAFFDGAFDASGGSRSPTPFPATFANNILVCPTPFDGDNKNVVLTSCSFDACTGSIEWCALNDAKTYRLLVGINGDYNALAERITITFGGAIVVGTANDQCGSNFVQVFDRTAVPSGGILRMSYSNSDSVENICPGFIAMIMNATLIEL